MDVDLENIPKNTENFVRNLRKRKKDSFVKRSVKHRTQNNRINPRKSSRRHKSLEPRSDLPKDAQNSVSSASTASLDSVIYLGYYRKIPQLITLDEKNGLVENREEDQVQSQVTENKIIGSSPQTFEETTFGQIVNNSSNETRDTNNLLDLLNEMCVVTTNKKNTRSRARRCKK